MLRKLISIIICFALLISIIPIYVLAETGPKDSIVTESEESAVSETLKEVEGKRDEFSKTYVDKDNNFTKEIYIDPIHTEMGGEWTEISTDVKLDEAEGVLETESTLLEATYPTEMSSNEEIIYTFENHNLEFSNITASDGSKEFSLNPNANTRFEENKVFYEQVLPGIDLRHVSLNNEVKEDWIIRDYEGIHQFNYEVSTDLIAHLEEDGSIGFYEDEYLEKKVFKLPSPTMEDSNINEALGHGVKSTDLHYELNSLSNSRYAIQLVVDEKWLVSEERVFPIYVDPTVTINTYADSYVSSVTPDTNLDKQWNAVYGEYVLKVGKYDTSTGTNYAYVKFDSTDSLSGTIVDSAFLSTYVTHTYSSTEKTGLWLDKVNASWLSGTITWNNKPSSTNIASTIVGRDQWANFNVTETIQNIADGNQENYGFKLHTNGNGQTYWKQLSAAENANKTKIVVNYHYPTMKSPTVMAAQYGDGLTTGYTNVSWPAIYGAQSYELQMFNGKTFEKVYAGTGTSWTTKGKKIFPLAPYSTTSAYKLDGSGAELAVDPSNFYIAKSGVATTRKEYGFKVLAKYESGSSPVSAEVKKAIPAEQIDTPNMPTVKASAYPETDTVNKGRGWLDISWEPVPGATGYRVLLYNGKENKEFSIGNVTSWSTKGQKIWPTDAEIAAGESTLHNDELGAELPVNPNPVYVNSGGTYTAYTRYPVRIKAVSSLGVTPQSDSQYGYIPLAVPNNVKVSSTEIVDYVDYVGALNIQWDAVADAGGYVINFFDGVKYQQIEVGNVTNWSTRGITLFDSVESDLPVDPTNDYLALNTTNLTALDKKAYVFNVQAYRHTEANSPDTLEKEKMEGYRGLGAKSPNVYATIPEEATPLPTETVKGTINLELSEEEIDEVPIQTEEELLESARKSYNDNVEETDISSDAIRTQSVIIDSDDSSNDMMDYYGELEEQGVIIEDFIQPYEEFDQQMTLNSINTVDPSYLAAAKVKDYVEVAEDLIFNTSKKTITIKQTIVKKTGTPSLLILENNLYNSNNKDSNYSFIGSYYTELKGTQIYVGKSVSKTYNVTSTKFWKTNVSATLASPGKLPITKKNSSKPVLANKIGYPYPRIKHPFVNEYLPIPTKANMKVLPVNQRVKRSSTYRANYIKSFDNTYGIHNWTPYVIHHVKPLMYGGDNSISNLFPLKKWDHQNLIHGSGFWNNY